LEQHAEIWHLSFEAGTGIGALTHFPLEQESLVHALLSSQFIGVWTHPVLISQVSMVQGSLSSQFLAELTHPFLESQVSTVHLLVSKQATRL
jgi:hypothetical protein